MNKTKALPLLFSLLFVVVSLVAATFILWKKPAEPVKEDGPQTSGTTIFKNLANDTYQNQSENFQAIFSQNPTLDSSIQVSNRLGSLSFFTPTKQPFGVLKEPILEAKDNSLTYRNIGGSLDLRYTLFTNRLLEEFIVHNPLAAAQINQIDQVVSLENISGYEERDGEILFYNDNGPVFRVPQPVIYELENPEEKSYAIVYKLQKNGKNSLVVSKVLTEEGKRWLLDRKRHYPIAIDLVLDNADTVSNWSTSNSTSLPISQETTLKTEGTGSVKMDPISWWNDTYSYRIKLTFANAARGALQNFPVLVTLNSSRVSHYTSIQSDCDDLRFIDSNNSTVLNYDIDVCNTSGTTLVWVNVPEIDSSNSDFIYMYYGNSSASSGENEDGTWNSNYLAVYHFEEDPSGSPPQIRDSSGNGNHGTVGGGMTNAQEVAAYIGNGLDFDGADDRVDTNFNATLTTMTFEAIIQPDNYGESLLGRIFDKRSAGGSEVLVWYTNGASSANRLTFIQTHSSTPGRWETPANSIIANGTNWYVASVAYDNSSTSNDPVFFLNGSLVATGEAQAPSGTVSTNTDNYLIGNRNNGGNYDRTFDGTIDELRIHNVKRSNDWLDASYDAAADILISYDSEVPAPVNQTVTKTFGTAQNLSTAQSINFYVRSDRSGSFMRIQMGETDSSEQTYDFTISSPNTWELKTWDISGINALQKDAITKLAFKPTDVDTSDFVFYFDDITTNIAPSTPTLDSPSNGQTGVSLTPTLKTTATDGDSDFLRYKIELCTNQQMTQNCQTFDQDMSQVGWSGQDTQSGTAYNSGTQANYALQSSLSPSTTYYFRSYAKDPSGTNTFSTTQDPPNSFTTGSAPPPYNTQIQGVEIQGVDIR